MEIDSRDFADAVCTDDTYRYMELELGRDNRRNNNKGDLQQRYQNYRSWSNSQMARDVDKVVNLVSHEVEISVRDLKQGLKTYGFSDDYAAKVIRVTGENDRRIKARRRSYSSEIDDIQLKRIER